MKWGFGDIDIFVGNITELVTEAIVCPINSELVAGIGVSAVILREAGSQVQKELSGIGKLSIGSAARTSAGNLKNKHIIHAATMSISIRTTRDSLEECLKSVFAVCRQNQIQSVAIPPIGIDTRNLPEGVVSDIMMNAATESLLKSRVPSRIVLVVPSEAVEKLYENSFKRVKFGD